jgi:aminoglycoside phosphotransferase (APT) family kinase protein
MHHPGGFRGNSPITGAEGLRFGSMNALHGLPRVQLDTYLRTHLRDVGGLTEIERLPGGQSNPTYLLATQSTRYVLRCKPAGQLLPSAHALDREFRILTALCGSPVPVPPPLLYCADPAVIGSEFYVMAYVDGCIFWDPALPGVGAAIRPRIYDEMNRVLAALHQLNPAGLGLGDYGRAGGYFVRQIRRWTGQYRASETDLRPDIERLIAWLPCSIPPDDGQAGVVHGDFRLDNIIFDESGHVLALLDWELSTLGHPFADLAYQCAQWRLPAGSLRGLNGVNRAALGIPSEDAYVATYLERRGLPGSIPSWEFYLVLSLFRLAAICQGVYRRGLTGNASSEAALSFGSKVDVIAGEAVAILASAGL